VSFASQKTQADRFSDLTVSINSDTEATKRGIKDTKRDTGSIRE